MKIMKYRRVTEENGTQYRFRTYKVRARRSKSSKKKRQKINPNWIWTLRCIIVKSTVFRRYWMPPGLEELHFIDIWQNENKINTMLFFNYFLLMINNAIIGYDIYVHLVNSNDVSYYFSILI